MKNITIVNAVFFLFIYFVAPFAAAENGSVQRATITSIIGRVEVSPEGSGKWRSARVSMPVKAGWDLRTFVESSADIELGSGSVIKIGENAVVTLSKLLSDASTGASNTSVKVGTGKIWANVKKLTTANSGFEFETPTAVASIRGTRLGIKVDAEGTSVDVFEGLVQVREKSTGKTVSVPVNGRAVVLMGGKGVTYIDLGKGAASKKDNAPMIDPFADSSGARTHKDSTGAKGQQGLFSPAKSGGVTLSLSSPKENEVIAEPMIHVSGTASAGAKVLINGSSITVGPSGSFSYKMPIPDEPHEYTITVVARLGDNEASEERMVTYAPLKAAMFLNITTPTEGQLIRQNLLHLTGKTSPRATVTVNEHPAMVSNQGIITYDLPLLERDIGDFRLEIRATDDSREVTKIITTVVDIASQQINTSVPNIVVHEQNLLATRTGKLTVCGFDRTAGDLITIQFQNNGRMEEYVIPTGECQTINLDEGKNKYVVKAFDKAKNVSNIVSGSLPYLPGPLVIEIREPSENPLVIDDLPPMPKNVAASHVRVEAEILDGIGNVPETIRYCRLVGEGLTLQMTGNNNYRYYTTIPLTLGSHTYSVQVEDLTGNIMTKRLDIVVK
jgi:hypothetical protein